MAKRNLDFKAELEKAEQAGALARARAGGVLDRQLERIAQAHANIALKGQEEAVRGKVQYGILKGRGVLAGDGAQVAVGIQINEPPKIINLLPAELGKPFREIEIK